MVNSGLTRPSQAAIGRALGLSPASISKYKRHGMPVRSIEAAQAWRSNNTKLTIHAAHQSTEGNVRASTRAIERVAHALALADIAAVAMDAGQNIDAMVPMLRAALHAVPRHARNESFSIPMDVWNLLPAHVFEGIQPFLHANEPSNKQSESPMSNEDAAYLGEFWYQVAAGEIQLNHESHMPKAGPRQLLQG